MMPGAMTRRAFTLMLGAGVAGMMLASAGCNATKKEVETFGADKVRTTKGESAEYVSDRHGQLIVWDDNTAKAIHTQEINKGDRVLLDLKAEILTINDRDLKIRLDKTHRYNIYVK